MFKKTFFIFLFSGLFTYLQAQEINTIPVKSQMKDVTVFLQGAQIHRTANVSVPAGTHILKFTGLTPYTDPKSIRLKAKGKIMILSVDFEKNYLDSLNMPKELKEMEMKLKKRKEDYDQTLMEIDLQKKKIDFLNQNIKINDANQKITVNDLQNVGSYYEKQMRLAREKIYRLEKHKNSLEKRINDLTREINKYKQKNPYKPGEIHVKVFAPQTTQAQFNLKYYTSAARWFPSYDIRTGAIGKPLNVTYKAHVIQTTGNDWKQIKLRLSSHDVQVSNELPRLKPYKLSTYVVVEPTGIVDQSQKVTGIVLDAKGGDPLPGVNISIKGSSIGTVTDFDGKFNILLPQESAELEFSYVGYENKTVRVKRGEHVKVRLKPGNALEYVVVKVTGTSRETVNPKKFAAKGMETDDDLGETEEDKKEVEAKPIPLPVERVEKQISVNFDIQRPYTVKSGNQPVTVPLQQYEIPAQYHYEIAPKIKKLAVLTASFTGWEQYHMLAGEANVFFDGTFLGKTLLDATQTNDTMLISLGTDPGIGVNRELETEHSKTFLIGSRKKTTKSWKITVKNNKNLPADIVLTDQVPVALDNSIDVKVEELSGGRLNEKTGLVQWKFRLNPGESKVLKLRYSVKYPRYSNIQVE